MKNIRKRLKYLFPVFIFIMVVGLIFSRMYQSDSTPPEPEVRINVAEASEYIDTAAEVCGEVTSSDYVPELGGEPTFLNLGKAHPNQLFSVVIWSSHRAKWKKPPDQLYANQEICVSGIIEIHEGTPQIIVENPNQIKIQN